MLSKCGKSWENPFKVNKNIRYFFWKSVFVSVSSTNLTLQNKLPVDGKNCDQSLKLLSAYLGTLLSQVNGVRHPSKQLKDEPWSEALENGDWLYSVASLRQQKTFISKNYWALTHTQQKTS